MTRLLIGYDTSEPARAALAAAAALFPRADAVVVTVQPPPPPLEAGALARVALPDAMIHEGLTRMREQAEERGRAIVEEGQTLAQDAGLQAVTRVVEGLSAWRRMLDAARESAADVIACGTRGAGALERVVLGSTASSLLHHADVPLLVAPPGEAPLDGPVLAGYDGSDGARDALRFASEHLRERPLVIANAWRSPVRHTVRGSVLLRTGVDAFAGYIDAVDTVWEEQASETAEAGVAFARTLGLTARAATPESEQGEWHALLGAAREEGAAVILVGSRGRGAVASTVLGSVASGLVHAAALPVVVVPA